jgi:mannan endo-1,4-beta-mannosidase
MDVFNSDPKKNCLFTLHLYGEWCSGGSQPTVGLPAVKNAGIPIIVGEFAAQSSAGTLNAASVISTCETNKMGWMAWSWKGNGEVALDMSSDWAGTNLTSWGKTAVTGTYGTKTAVTCSVFTGIVDTKNIGGPTLPLTNYMTLKTGAGGRVSIGLSGISGVATVEVVDAKGKLVCKRITSGQSLVDVNMPGKAGVYLVKAITERGDMSKTLLVQ